jgi:proline dehydrogenase
MLARLLLALAASEHAKSFVTHFPPARRMSRRFVAGETLEQAIAALQGLVEQKLAGMLDLLGESIHDAAAAGRAAAEYLDGIARIRAGNLPANVSLKPTQMGLDISESLCVENLRTVAGAADDAGRVMEMDMESSAYTERTIAIYERLRAEFPNVGVAIQAYLRRSEADISRLIAIGARVRIVKGAYLEPDRVAITNRKKVDANYGRLLKRMLAPAAIDKGFFPCIATHDPRLIERALTLIDVGKIPPDKYEFQMLYGIRRDLQAKLAAAGRPIRVYVSYGSQWYPYFMRRLAERPANLLFLLRAIFGG